MPTSSRLFVWYILVKAMGGVFDYFGGIRRADLGKMIFYRKNVSHLTALRI